MGIILNHSGEAEESALVRRIGVLPASLEPRLTAAIVKAFDLVTPA